MRITIETTVSEPQFSHTSIVEVPYDDIDLNAQMELIQQTLLGYGWSPKLLNEWFDPDAVPED